MRGLRGLVLSLAILCPCLPALAQAPAGGDVLSTSLLSILPAVKAALPLGAALASGGDRDALPAAGAGILLWTLPNGMLLASAWRGDGPATRFWRGVSLAVDAGLSAACLGYGVWLLNHVPPGSFNDIVGALSVTVSVPIGVAAGLDLVPFPAERGP